MSPAAVYSTFVCEAGQTRFLPGSAKSGLSLANFTLSLYIFALDAVPPAYQCHYDHICLSRID
jgi:hypothetical protein